MAIQRKIRIYKDGEVVKFDPPVLEANPRDQIFWSNEDDAAHWPRLTAIVPDQPTLTDDQKRDFFMTNQIAGNSVSSIFAPAPFATGVTEVTFDYDCSLAGHSGEKGKITVT